MGEGNRGYEGQEGVLDPVRARFPPAAKVMVLGERFFGSPDLIRYCQRHGWGYRLGLKGTLLVDTGRVNTTMGEELHRESPLRALPDRRAAHRPKSPHPLSILHEAGHEQA